MYGRGGNLDDVTCISYIHISSPFLQMILLKYGFDWPSGFRGEDL